MLQTLRSQSFSLTSKTAPFTSFLCFNGPHLIVECEEIFKIIPWMEKSNSRIYIHELVVHKKVFNEHWTNFFLMRPCIAHLHNVRVLCLWNFIWCRQSDRPSLANCWRKHWLLPSGENRRYFETSTTLQFLWKKMHKEMLGSSTLACLHLMPYLTIDEFFVVGLLIYKF